VNEVFCDFYETSDTSADAIYEVIKDCLIRFNSDITNCRGQCYAGAANMSGSISGVQTRLRVEERRAVYVHCCAHSLNLVVQDALRQVNRVRDFLNSMRELITLVRASPKRLAMFQSLQADDDDTVAVLKPLCPTRWCV
jgi:hypothetical protein